MTLFGVNKEEADIPGMEGGRETVERGKDRKVIGQTAAEPCGLPGLCLLLSVK